MKDACAHTRARTHTCTHAHVHTHTYTHTHTENLLDAWVPPQSQVWFLVSKTKERSPMLYVCAGVSVLAFTGICVGVVGGAGWICGWVCRGGNGWGYLWDFSPSYVCVDVCWQVFGCWSFIFYFFSLLYVCLWEIEGTSALLPSYVSQCVTSYASHSETWTPLQKQVSKVVLNPTSWCVHVKVLYFTACFLRPRACCMLEVMISPSQL